MSLCWSSLVLLLGAVLTSGSPLHSKPDDIEKLLKVVNHRLRLTEPEVGIKSLFTPVISSINTSCQRKADIQLMNATLDVYTRMLSSILQQHHGGPEASRLLDTVPSQNRSKVEEAVRNLQQEMKELQRNLNQEHHSREEMMLELSKIRVDDPLHQRRALADFRMVHNTASVIGSHCG